MVGRRRRGARAIGSSILLARGFLQGARPPIAEPELLEPSAHICFINRIGIFDFVTKPALTLVNCSILISSSTISCHASTSNPSGIGTYRAVARLAHYQESARLLGALTDSLLDR